MFIIGYVRCPACASVVHDPDLSLVRVETPAPCCGERGKPRSVWPGIQAIKLLEIADGQDGENPDGHRIAILFLASAFEVMLEEALVELVRHHTSSDVLVEAVLESHQGFHRRRRLFKRLSGEDLKSILPDDFGKSFLQDWSALVDQRNRIAHGRYFYPESEDVALLTRIRESYLPAFAGIHNYVVRQPGNGAA